MSEEKMLEVVTRAIEEVLDEKGMPPKSFQVKATGKIVQIHDLLAEAALRAVREAQWQKGEPPKGVEFLAELEDKRSGMIFHTGIVRESVIFIGNHFSFDMPKIKRWMLIPPTPPKEK